MGGGAIDLEMDPKSKIADRATAPTGAPADSAAPGRGIVLERFFTTAGVDPYSEVEWDLRSAVISGEDGRVVFEQQGRRGAARMVANRDQRRRLEIFPRPARQRPGARPASASSSPASSIPSPDGARSRATSQALDARETFHAELTKYLLLNQKASFNSPVYFNVGIEAKPQCSACFILKVDDSMDSILNWYRNEGMIFKGGSGAGVNLSALRSCREKLSSGGTASGPLSFMKAADASCRRHQVGRQDAPRGQDGRAQRRPSRHRSISSSARQEEEQQGVGADRSRLRLLARRPGLRLGVLPERQQFGARDRRIHARGARRRRLADPLRQGPARSPRPTARATLLRMIAEAAHACGDPGMQFDTTINVWHTCPDQRADQRVESVQRVHASGQLGLQPRLAQPAEVHRRARRVRRQARSATRST